MGCEGGCDAMRATVLTIFSVSLIVAGIRFKACCKKRCGEFCREPKAFVAQMLSMDASLSAKYFWIGNSSHAAAA